MLIDTHCHLPHKKYSKTLDQIIADAAKSGIANMVNIGTSLKENTEALKVSEKYINVFSAVGIYPHDDKEVLLETLESELTKQILSSKKVVAIGECGLDISNWEGGRSVKEQIPLFEMQLALASKHNLPVVIHNRGGDDVIFDILTPYTQKGLIGVAHCFASDKGVAQRYLDLGFYLSFSAMITYKGRDALREVAKWVPQDRILVETDAPYLPPQQFRGQVNEPKNVVEVAKKLAEIRGEQLENIENFTYSNACQLLSLKAV